MKDEYLDNQIREIIMRDNDDLSRENRVALLMRFDELVERWRR